MSRLPKIVGLMGNIGAGKTSVSAYLAETYHFTARGFADPIYDQLTILNPLIQTGTSLTTPQNHYYKDLVEEYGVDFAKRNFQDIRRYLRLLGTECGRDVFGDNCWVNVMEIRSRTDVRTAIHDVRFPNEVSWIRAAGGALWHIISPKEIPAVSTHRSETSLDFTKEADYTVYNDGTLNDLQDKVEALLDDYAIGMNT